MAPLAMPQLLYCLHTGINIVIMIVAIVIYYSHSDKVQLTLIRPSLHR